ncbi:hypothetical protein B0J12DRAFT_705998 [Macrophomina phaseolina]|uniref:BZIP domain-containing protein n=1 Tax=Macrophomina phaseolina TaxID=35725 RepID=A0ABQ8FQI0_9PEZI|nr:hypothetical protein B0J12DRAFT_705998 [Macrophomina phaseolina]
MGSEIEERPTKKRARTFAPTEPTVKSKKQRGRPQVDTQDKTASDRRRTQIRLAQRAYRRRKDSTISSLQKQVERLQAVIDNMNSSFLRFNDQAMASGIFALHPSLAYELKQATETFVNLAKTAKTVATEDEGEDSQEGSEPSAEQPAATADLSSRNYQGLAQSQRETAQVPGVDAQVPNVDPRNNAQSTHIGMGYYEISHDAEAMAYGYNVDLYLELDLSKQQGLYLEALRDPVITKSC